MCMSWTCMVQCHTYILQYDTVATVNRYSQYKLQWLYDLLEYTNTWSTSTITHFVGIAIDSLNLLIHALTYLSLRREVRNARSAGVWVARHDMANNCVVGARNILGKALNSWGTNFTVLCLILEVSLGRAWQNQRSRVFSLSRQRQRPHEKNG